jgi:tetratricopeptide (TPR) repeat protein
MSDNTPTSRPEEPARFESPPLGLADHQHFQQYQNRNNKILWGIFMLLLVLTGGVLFVLPNMVAPVAPPPAVVVAQPSSQAAAVEEPAPFAEAQRMRQRQEAQDALAPLLELQETLEEQQVQQWAGDAFSKALATAAEGDAAYSAQRYDEALSLYKQAHTGLQTISTNISAIYEDRLAAGNAALAAGDAEAADAAFSIAILLQPTSSEAVTGMERARVLDQVLQLLAAGRTLQDNGQFEEARASFQQARNLDPANTEAQALLSQVDAAQAERNFSSVMSRGFAALQAGDPQAAKAAFEQANALRPGSSEVSAALQQANDQQTLKAITVHVQAAEAAEAREEWASALASWTQALTIDPNLVSAQNGQRRTQSRTNLDQFLTDTIANPTRLGDQAIYAQTEQVLRDARNLLVPGAKLQNQLQQVEQFMTQVKVPVAVQIHSDGQTAVTVYGIGELGLITSHSLNLLPGTYVAVGVREGYRDVREEFVVGLDGKALQVTVACTETI